MRWPRLPVAAAAALALSVLSAPPGSAQTPPSPQTAPAQGVRPLATPVLSVRRDPAWIDDTLARQRLTGALSAAAAPQLGATKGVAACVLVAQNGALLYAVDPATPLIPASNLKLVTAAAVLATLGADHRFTTTVKASARSGGTVVGNVYLVGGGDPYLMTAAHNSRLYYPEPVYTSLDGLAASVRAAGITAVTGSVVGDASRYDSLIGVPTWAPEYLLEGDVGPLSALEVDDGSPPQAPPPPPGAKVTPVRPAAADPPLFAAQAFTDLLKAHGVTVAGPAATGRSPGGALTVTSATSAPLGAEVAQMLRVSDDTAAELLTKELGYHVSGQGTTSAGTAVIRRQAADQGLPVSQLAAVDGSGLDRGDRASCSLITQVLQQAGTAGVLPAGLPVAGRTGTLTDRMSGTVAAGRLHAKTGTLHQVTALSGFVDPVPAAPTPELRAPVFFSIIINGMDTALAAPLADRIAVAVAGYPNAVPLSRLEPLSSSEAASRPEQQP